MITAYPYLINRRRRDNQQVISLLAIENTGRTNAPMRGFHESVVPIVIELPDQPQGTAATVRGEGE